MSGVPEHLLILVVAALVVLAPGAALLSLTGAARSLNPYLQPAAAIVASMVPLSMVTLLSLALRLNVNRVTAVTVATTVLLVAVASARRWRRRRDASRSGRVALHPGVIAIAAATAVIAYLVGTFMDYDALYHAGVAQRMIGLPHPSLDVTSRYIDGGPNPVYLIPVWQLIIAVVSHLAGSDVVTTMWVLPALIAPIASLTYAGLAAALFRSQTSAWFGALAHLVSYTLIFTREFHSIEFQIYPGYVTLDLLLPIAVAAWLASCWPDGLDRRRPLLLLVATLGAVLVLHANYVFFLGLMIAGYLLLWAMAGGWSRAVVRSHLVAAATVGAATALGLGSLIPVYHRLSHFARSAQDDSIRRLFTDDRFEDMLRGTIAHYHLRADYMVTKIGGLAIFAMYAIVALLALRRRMPAAWVLGGAMLTMLGVSQSERLFEFLMRVGSTTAGSRLDQALALYLVMGLAFGMLALAAAIDGLWRWHSAGRAMAIATVIATGVALGALAVTWPKRDPDMPGLPTIIALWTLIAVIAVLMLVRLASLLRGGGTPIDVDGHATVDGPTADPPAASVMAPATHDALTFDALLTPGRVGVMMATFAVALATAIPIVRASQGVLAQADDRGPRADEMDTLERFHGPVRRALQSLPPGSVVLGPLEVSYELTALAPVYVVADHKYWLADTAQSRNIERRRLVRQFFSSRTSDGERLRILRGRRPVQHGHGVDMLLVGEPPRPHIERFLHDHPTILHLAAYNGELRAYSVNRQAASRQERIAACVDDVQGRIRIDLDLKPWCADLDQAGLLDRDGRPKKQAYDRIL